MTCAHFSALPLNSPVPDHLEKGKDVACLSLRDPTIYSMKGDPMEIIVVQDTEEKRNVIAKCDPALPRGLLNRDNYETIFSKIDEHAIFIGAYDRGETIGYAAIYANDRESQIAFITVIAVLEKMQGKHVGSALMKKCIAKAVNAGMRYIRLEVLDSNTKAIDFYHHCGFEYEKKCSEASSHLIKKIV